MINNHHCWKHLLNHLLHSCISSQSPYYWRECIHPPISCCRYITDHQRILFAMSFQTNVAAGAIIGIPFLSSPDLSPFRSGRGTSKTKLQSLWVAALMQIETIPRRVCLNRLVQLIIWFADWQLLVFIRVPPVNINLCLTEPTVTAVNVLPTPNASRAIMQCYCPYYCC